MLYAAPQADGARPVFQIGTFDRSSFEFDPGDPQHAVRFVVGQSSPDKDWYARQPAELQSRPTPATAPRAIVFSLTAAPEHAYRFHAALLIETASVPALLVEIDGKRGLFYLHPQLDYSNGDQGDSFYPAFSHADVEFTFPGSFLHRGENTIQVQAIEQADQVVPEASITWDALELDGMAKRGSSSSSALIEPTVFFRQQGQQLDEEVDAFIRSDQRLSPGSKVDLRIAGKSYRETLEGEHEFGEEKVIFQVPEFPAHSQAQLAWRAAGHEQHESRSLDPQKKWTLYLVPHIHLDVGYSDYQGKIAAIQSHALDEALRMSAEHPAYRFSTDGEWNFEQFARTRTPAQQQRAIEAMQQGKLFVPADYANLLTGFPTAETLIRSLYPGADLSRAHHTPFNYATITDVPSWSWSYASILAAAGVHQLLGGSNNYRAPVLLQGRLNEDSPVWWEGPDGGKVLLWYSRIYLQMQMLFGLPPVIDVGRDIVPLFLQMYEHPGYHADAAILYGSQVENTDLFPQQAVFADQWNAQYAFPHIQYSGFHDALEAIRKQFGDTIPTIRGDGGPYWEDGIASDAYYAAMERWNEARGPSAEKLATLTGLISPILKPDTGDLNRMWKDMVLMDEHTWDSWNSISDPHSREAVEQLKVKDQYAVNAAALADFIVKDSLATLVQHIPAAPGSLVVFNPLNWQRDGLVSIDLDRGQQIVDPATGKMVPYEDLGGDSNLRHIQFVASDVPAVGYKVYTLKDAPENSQQTPATSQTTVLENSWYRVTLDPASGSIRSIYDKQLGRELVNQQGPWRFGEYLYVTGGGKAPNTILQYSHVYPKPQLDVHPATDGKLISVARTPWGQTARMVCESTNTPSITTEIRLFDKEKKIELIEDLDKKEVDTKEAVYFAFPFAMDHPQFQYEIQNGVVDPAKDMYPGAGHEWFSVQHWVSVQQDGVSGTVMPLDVPLVTLGDINRGEWPESFGNRSGTIFSYVMDNYWDTNYRAGQGGHFRFHYIVTSAASTAPAELSRVGWEEVTPIEADLVTTQDKALTRHRVNGTMQYPDPAEQVSLLHMNPALDPTRESFLHADDPDLVLTAWKPAEDGNGTILRFLDLGGSTRTVTVETPSLTVSHAWRTDAVERDQQELPPAGSRGFQFTVHPHEIVTVRVAGSQP